MSAIVGVVAKKREGGGWIGEAESDQTISLSQTHHAPTWMYERNRKISHAQKKYYGDILCKLGICRFYLLVGALPLWCSERRTQINAKSR